MLIFAGQSNAGNTTDLSVLPTEPVDLRLPQTDVLFNYWNPKKDWASDGWISLQPIPNAGPRFGPEVLFGRALANAYPNEQFAILKVWAGGTNLRTGWDPDATTGARMYSSLTPRLNDGLALLVADGFNPVVSGFFWTQGEGDSGKLNPAIAYEQNLTNFIASVRSDWGYMPFVFNQLHVDADREFSDVLRQSQANVTANVDGVVMINIDDLALGADSVHLTAEGRRDLGVRLGNGYLQAANIGGDANLDGFVTFGDFAVLQPNFGQPGNWPEGDFDSDGQVTFADFAILQNNFGMAVAPAATPEPATLALLVCGGLLFGWRPSRSAQFTTNRVPIGPVLPAGPRVCGSRG
ncbi:MAG: sialate O-acetylesterase [Phycisphaeraceae bacterium]